MQFTGKAPHIGLNSSMREQKSHDQEARLVLDAIAGDPAFRVRTVDGSQWICPYLGTLVACTADWAMDAQNYLFKIKPWMTRRGGKPRPAFQVLEDKWRLYLNATPDAKYLQFDAAGRWLNPLTKAAEQLPRARSAADPRAIPDIMRALARCDMAESAKTPTGG